MTLKEKHALKVKLGKCYSSDKRRIMEIAKREIDSMPTTEERPHEEYRNCMNCMHYNLFGIDENTTHCDHPALYRDDPFCGVALATKPQDTCSYFTPKGGDKK